MWKLLFGDYGGVLEEPTGEIPCGLSDADDFSGSRTPFCYRLMQNYFGSWSSIFHGCVSEPDFSAASSLQLNPTDVSSE